MSATSSSSDKFLFLFTTDSDDLSGIKSALQDYYNFPSGNTFEATGCNSFVSTYKSVIYALRGSDPDPAMNTYTVPDPAGLTPGSEPKSLTLVVVISGNADSNGLFDYLGGTPLPWAKIRQTIYGTIPNPAPKTYNYQVNTEIHLIFVSPFCNSFLAECIANGFPITNKGAILIPPTASDQIDQPSREAFLTGLASHLKLETSTPLDSCGRISINDIASSLGLSDPDHFALIPSATTDKYFFGYSWFEIHDGSPDWWESDDIYINYYNNDLYNVGVPNTIFVNVHTSGTHPVKNFWIGIKIFWSGLGPAETMKIEQITTSGPLYSLPAVLKGGESFLYQYTVTLSANTHRCITARVKFNEIHDTDIDDYSEWSIEANADEAQRNIDPAPVSPPLPVPEPPAPGPGEGQNPDPDPAPDDTDQNNTGDRSLWNIRGVKEHIYSVLNTFREKRRFRVAFNREFLNNSRGVKFNFFRMNGKKLELLKIQEKPYPHIPLALESGERADILFYFAIRKNARLPKELRLPIEILAETKGKLKEKIRKSEFTDLDNGYAPAGGLTIKTVWKAYSVYGHVYDVKGKALPGAKVYIRTVNGRQAAVIKTDEKGAYYIPGINPDSYRMYVETRKWSSKNRIVNLFTRDLNIDFMEGR